MSRLVEIALAAYRAAEIEHAEQAAAAAARRREDAARHDREALDRVLEHSPLRSWFSDVDWQLAHRETGKTVVRDPESGLYFLCRPESFDRPWTVSLVEPNGDDRSGCWSMRVARLDGPALLGSYLARVGSPT